MADVKISTSDVQQVVNSATAAATTAAANVATTTATTAATEASGLQTRAVLHVIFLGLTAILLVAAGLWTLYALEGVLLLVVLAIFFAYLVAPLVDMVRRPFKMRGGEYMMPRGIAIGIVYLILFGSLGVTLYLLVPRLVEQVGQFTKQSSTYNQILQGRTQQAVRPIIARLGLPPATQEAVMSAAPRALEAARNFGEQAATTIIASLGYVPWMVLIPILGFFLLKDAEGFRRSALQMLPRGRLRWRGDEFFQDVNSTLAAYIRAQLTACLIIGVICTAGFGLIGVNYWLPLGIIAGLLEFIPLAGPLTVIIIAAVVASFESASQAVIVVIFLIVLRGVQDYVLYPRIIGSGIHLHPLAVVLAILCGEQLAGLAGIFLAIPVVAIISVTYRHWLEHRGSEGLVAELLKPAEQAATTPLTDELGTAQTVAALPQAVSVPATNSPPASATSP